MRRIEASFSLRKSRKEAQSGVYASLPTRVCYTLPTMVYIPHPGYTSHRPPATALPDTEMPNMPATGART